MGNKTYVEADWATGNVTLPFAQNWRNGVGAVQVVVTGTINFDLESSNSDLQNGGTAQWLVDSAGSSAISASKWVTFNATPRFLRLKVNSFTTGATVSLNVTQSDV